jgi:hypothetical protein
MHPDVPAHQETPSLAEAPPLSAVLILPTIRREKKPSIWVIFLWDLTILLPAFGAALGALLYSGGAPIAGAFLLIVCPFLLLERVFTLYQTRQQRRGLAAMAKRYQELRKACLPSPTPRRGMTPLPERKSWKIPMSLEKSKEIWSRLEKSGAAPRKPAEEIESLGASKSQTYMGPPPS